MSQSISECATIKCLLSDNALIMDVDVMPEQFESSVYKNIYSTIKKMLADREVVDDISLAERMFNDTGRDWLETISNISTGVGTKGNIKSYCELIKRNYQARKAQEIGNLLVSNAKSPEAISEAIKSLMNLGREDANYEYSLNDALKIGISAIDEAFRNEGSIVGLSTGLNSLDECLGGFHDSDLVIVGGRPAMGKTSVLLNMLVRSREHVGCFSGEQGVSQVVQRLMSMESNVSLMSMRNGKMSHDDWTQLELGARMLKQHKGIRLYDKSSPSIDDIESRSRRWKFEYDIKAIYIDYLQKIKKDPKKPKVEAIAENVGRLKDLAKELNIPIICLAQVSRSVEQRPNKRPMMSDIADCSEIEKEADQIIMLYRDEVYNPDENVGMMELLIEKNRHGATGCILIKWEGKYLKVSDLG